jgi:hypothetical protein
MVEGYSETEIARELGISKRSVCGLIDELRDELEQQGRPG